MQAKVGAEKKIQQRLYHCSLKCAINAENLPQTVSNTHTGVRC